MSLEFLRWQYLKAVVNAAVSSKVFFSQMIMNNLKIQKIVFKMKNQLHLVS